MKATTGFPCASWPTTALIPLSRIPLRADFDHEAIWQGRCGASAARLRQGERWQLRSSFRRFHGKILGLNRHRARPGILGRTLSCPKAGRVRVCVLWGTHRTSAGYGDGNGRICYAPDACLALLDWICKGHDASKAIDKHLGTEALREVTGSAKMRDIRNDHGRGVGDGINAAGRDGPPEYLQHEYSTGGSPRRRHGTAGSTAPRLRSPLWSRSTSAKSPMTASRSKAS